MDLTDEEAGKHFREKGGEVMLRYNIAAKAPRRLTSAR